MFIRVDQHLMSKDGTLLRKRNPGDQRYLGPQKIVSSSHMDT